MAKSTFTKEEVYSISTQYFLESDTARKAEKELIWKQLISLLNNTYDFEDKEDWQSQGWIPIIPTLVENSKAKLMGAITKSPDIFTLKAFTDAMRNFKDGIDKSVRYWMLDNNDFYEKLDLLILSALISRLCAKAMWIETDERVPKFDKDGNVTYDYETIGKWIFEPISPFRIWQDPYGLDRYIIHEYDIDYVDLLEAAKVKENGYDLEAIKELQSIHYDERETIEWEAKQQGATKPAQRKVIHCFEFYGDLISQDGDKIERRKMWTIANQLTVIRMPIDNPSWMRKHPFIIMDLKKKFFETVGCSQFEDVRSLAYFQNDMFNLAADTAKFAGIRGFEVDADSLTYPAQIKNGIFPGMVLLVSRRSGQGKVIEPMTLGTVPQDLMGIIQYAEQKTQSGASISEFGLAEGPAAGRPTAREGIMKENASNFIFNSIARILESGFIEKLAEACFYDVMQYENFSRPELMEYIGIDAGKLSALTIKERYELCKGNLKFSVKGMSIELSRMQELQKIQDYISSLGGIETAKPVLIENGINIGKLIQRMTEDFGFKNADWIPDSPMEADQNKQESMAMMPPPPPQPQGPQPQGPPQGPQQGQPQPLMPQNPNNVMRGVMSNKGMQ